MQVQPYLFFNGRCEEAIDFYKRTLGAQVEMLMRFKDGPPPPPESEQCAGGAASPDMVMHACFKVGEASIMASDGMGTGALDFKGFSLSVTAGSEAEAEKLFAALGDNGQVQMPMAETFFAHRFGMVADKFGVSWMVIHPKPH